MKAVTKAQLAAKKCRNLGNRRQAKYTTPNVAARPAAISGLLYRAAARINIPIARHSHPSFASTTRTRIMPRGQIHQGGLSQSSGCQSHDEGATVIGVATGAGVQSYRGTDHTGVGALIGVGAPTGGATGIGRALRAIGWVH